MIVIGYLMKFDSNLEKKLYAQMKSCTYHPAKRIEYIIPKKYEPDFCYNNNGWMTYIEVKGRFRTREEARKYVEVRKALGKYEDLVFVFQNPNTPMPGSRRRKDGSRYRMRDWAEKNGFDWYTPTTLPKEWL
jgi:hypothetical protein